MSRQSQVAWPLKALGKLAYSRVIQDLSGYNGDRTLDILSLQSLLQVTFALFQTLNVILTMSCSVSSKASFSAGFGLFGVGTLATAGSGHHMQLSFNIANINLHEGCLALWAYMIAEIIFDNV